MQPRCDLGRVPLVVQLEQSIEQLVLRLWANREPHPLWCFPVVMVQFQVAPAVCVAHGMVELDMQLAESDDVWVVFIRVMHPVVRLRESELRLRSSVRIETR